MAKCNCRVDARVLLLVAGLASGAIVWESAKLSSVIHTASSFLSVYAAASNIKRCRSGQVSTFTGRGVFYV